MEISKGIGAIGLSLFFRKRRILAIADLHLGYEEMLNRQGVMMPRFNFKEIKARLKKILANTGKLEKIIILGDLKHEFGTISEQEWRNTLKFLDLLAKYCDEIILVKGNHDTILGPIARKRNVKVLDYVVIEPATDKSNNGKNSLKKSSKTLIAHGDKIPKEALKDVSTIIIGHEHPAVSLREGSRAEKFKCFLKGKWNGKGIIVMPSFNMAVEGSDVLKEELLSPFLSDISGFEVLVAGGNGETLDFGTVKKLQAL